MLFVTGAFAFGYWLLFRNLKMPELEQVLTALASAYNRLDYYEFLARTGFTDCSYSIAKFKLFQQSVKGLIEFDTKTIQSLLSVNHN